MMLKTTFPFYPAIAWIVILATVVSRPAQADSPPTYTPPGPPELTDPVEPLAPERARGEAGADRLQAAALFATGRLLEQRGLEGKALRRYQRAYRYDPSAAFLLNRIVPLAFKLGRFDEAVRYALIAIDRLPARPERMREMARHLTQKGELGQSIGLYEKLLKADPPEPKSLDAVRFHLELGRLYFLTKRHDRAARSFAIVEEALDHPQRFKLAADVHQKLLGKDGLTYHLFGEAYLRAGKLPAARKAFEKANRLAHKPGLLGYNVARVLEQQGDIEAAIENLSAYFEAGLTGEGDRPYELLVRLLEKQDQAEQVTARLEMLHAADSENEKLSLFLARHYLESQDRPAAETIFRRVAEDGNARSKLAALRGLVDVYRQAKDVPQLLETLTQTAALTGTLDVLGEAVEAVADDEKLVAELIARAEKQTPAGELPEGADRAMAELALQAQAFEAAARFYNRVLSEQAEQRDVLYEQWGLGLFRAEKYAEAAEVFKTAVRKAGDPQQRAAFLYYRSGALELSGRTDEALQAARDAAKKRTSSIDFAERIGWIQYHAGRYEEAIETYENVVARFDGEHDSSAVRQTLRQIRLILSNLNVHAKNLPQAERWLEEVLDEFPGDVGALNDLGYLWADQGKRLGRALRMIKKAVAAEPENKAYLDSLGWVYHRLGRPEEAIEPLEQAAAGEEPDGVILDHLGDVYEALGKHERAVEVWQRAIEQFEQDEDAEQVKRLKEKIRSVRKKRTGGGKRRQGTD